MYEIRSYRNMRDECAQRLLLLAEEATISCEVFPRIVMFNVSPLIICEYTVSTESFWDGSPVKQSENGSDAGCADIEGRDRKKERRKKVNRLEQHGDQKMKVIVQHDEREDTQVNVALSSQLNPYDAVYHATNAEFISEYFTAGGQRRA